MDRMTKPDQPTSPCGSTDSASVVPVSRGGEPALGIEWLLEPMSTSRFEAEFWERRPVHLSRKDARRFADLLSLAALDGLLSARTSAPRSVRLVRDGVETGLDQLRRRGGGGPNPVTEALYAAFRGGWTIVVQFLHERWEPLARLCQRLEGELSASVQANVYCTPPGGRAIGHHYDTHDVFVLQVHGTKRWILSPATTVLPLRGQPCRAGPGQDAESWEIELRAGDCLYLPRGWFHDAQCGDATSVHITLGVHTVTWASLLLGAIETHILEDPELRRSLPIGFAADNAAGSRAASRLEQIVAGLRESIDADAVIERARDGQRWGARPFLAGHLLDLEALPGLQVVDAIVLRPGVHHRIETDAEHALVAFHGKVIRTSLDSRAALERIAEGAPVAIAGLPGSLTRDQKLALARLLLREGLVTLPSTAELLAGS